MRENAPLHALRGFSDKNKDIMPQCLDLPQFVELLKEFAPIGLSDIIKDRGTMPLFKQKLKVVLNMRDGIST